MLPFRGSEPVAYNDFKHLISVGSGFDSSGSTILNKWNDYFKIVQKEEIPSSGATSWMLEEYYSYELHDNYGNIIATYKDEKYAKKQAKYKFKKIMAKLEKILLA